MFILSRGTAYVWISEKAVEKKATAVPSGKSV
jgi:hypothetical protein